MRMMAKNQSFSAKTANTTPTWQLVCWRSAIIVVVSFRTRKVGDEQQEYHDVGRDVEQRQIHKRAGRNRDGDPRDIGGPRTLEMLMVRVGSSSDWGLPAGHDRHLAQGGRRDARYSDLLGRACFAGRMVVPGQSTTRRSRRQCFRRSLVLRAVGKGRTNTCLASAVAAPVATALALRFTTDGRTPSWTSFNEYVRSRWRSGRKARRTTWRTCR